MPPVMLIQMVQKFASKWLKITMFEILMPRMILIRTIGGAEYISEANAFNTYRGLAYTALCCIYCHTGAPCKSIVMTGHRS